jgi:hypothetical protein
MKTYIFENLTVGVLRDDFNAILVQAGRATIDETNPAIVNLAQQHGGKPEAVKPKAEIKRSVK